MQISVAHRAVSYTPIAVTIILENQDEETALRRLAWYDVSIPAMMKAHGESDQVIQNTVKLFSLITNLRF